MPLTLDLSVGGVAICPPGSGVAPRVLDDHELVWIVSGDATWIRDGVEHPAPADTVILARPGWRDAYRWDPRRPSRVAYLHFRVLDGLDLLPPPARWPSLLRAGEHDVVRPLFRQLVTVAEQRPERWREIAHGAACHLLLSLVTGTHDTTAAIGRHYPDAVERAVLHVERQWERDGVHPVALDELCGAAAVSPRQLTRLFTETFGHGPVQTLRLARAQLAASLLAGTDLPLPAVAAATGFANAFHLSRVVKAAYGVPPRDIRAARRLPDTPPGLHEVHRLVGRVLPHALA